MGFVFRGNFLPKIRIFFAILSYLSPHISAYNVEIWPKRKDLGKIRNLSVTQEIVHMACRYCILISSSRGRARRHFNTSTGEHGFQFMAEAPPRDAVEEEVDAVVEETEEIADRLGILVRRVGAVFPVRLSNQQNDARSD